MKKACTEIRSWIARSIVLMFFFSISFPVYAQDRVLSLPDKILAPGDEFRVKVHIDNAQDVIGFRIVIEFPNTDPGYPLEYMTDSSSVSGTLAKGWVTWENNSSTTTSGRFAESVAITGSGVIPLSGTGDLLTFKIRVKEDATDQIIPLNFGASGAKVTRLNDGAIPVTFNHGSIVISTSGNIPTDTPTATAIATATPSPSPTLSPTATSSPTATPTATASSTPISSQTPSPTPTATFTPTATPTPTFTPTPPVVIITDNLESTADLSNGSDYDLPNDKALVIRWDFTQTNVDPSILGDIHIYVRIDGNGDYVFLGRTNDGQAQFLEWKNGSRLISYLYRSGPAYNHSYEFRVYFLPRSGQAYGPFVPRGPVMYLEGIDPTPTPTPTPTGVMTPSPSFTPTPWTGPLLIVTDDLSSMVDLSNGIDYDTASERILAVRWNLEQAGIDPGDVSSVMVYVRTDRRGPYALLGRVDNGNSYLEWREGNTAVTPAYRTGPDPGHLYQFRIYILTPTQIPPLRGPFDNAGPVDYRLGPDPTATPTDTPTATPTIGPTPVIVVTDDLTTTIDLSNGQDFDRPNERALVIRWTFPPSGRPVDLLDVFVYVRIDGVNTFELLGQTGLNQNDFLEWSPGGTHIMPHFRNGPEFGHFYEFQVFFFILSHLPPFDGPYTPAGPVEFLRGQEETPTPTPYPTITLTPAPSPTPIDTPTPAPTPDPGSVPYNSVIVTDTLTSYEDLSGGWDFDPPEQRDLVIRWNFDPDFIAQNEIGDVHVYVRVDGHGNYRYLGNSGQPTIVLVNWVEGNHKIAPAFQDGPQYGRKYEFMIIVLVPGPNPSFTTNGPVEFFRMMEPPPTPSQLANWEGNGHFYAVMDGNMSWPQALYEAGTMYDGSGYLATLTSPGETQFLLTSLGWEALTDHWLGGSQNPAIEEEIQTDYAQGWSWVTGEPWVYTNWETTVPEPNDTDRDEDYLQFTHLWFEPGSWNDESRVGHSTQGYIVEWDHDPRLPLFTPTFTPTPVIQPTPTVPSGWDSLNEVYTHNFESRPGREWSNRKTDVSPVGNRNYLGQFSNQTVSLTLNDLPAHVQIWVTYDLFILRSWDGNSTGNGPDILETNVSGGPVLMRTTFSNQDFRVEELGEERQAYPDEYPQGNHWAKSGAVENNTLGYYYNFDDEGRQPVDAVYAISHLFDHTGDSLTLNFTASGLQELPDESWGIDNISVSVSVSELPPLATPIPTAMPTATPEIPVGQVIVTDSIDTFVDLSGGEDYDAPGDRELTVRWHFAESEAAAQYHVYVKANGNNAQFLSRTEDGSETVLRWRTGKHFTANRFKDGPQSGASYQFFVFMLRNDGGNTSGPIQNAGPVQFNVGVEPVPIPSPTITPTPTPTIAIPAERVWVMKNLTSVVDLSGSVLDSNVEELCLVVRWNLVYDGIVDYHVYIQVDNNNIQYLGRTGSADITFLEWRRGMAGIDPAFVEGPRPGHAYKFPVFGITSTGQIYSARMDEPVTVE